jgi:hypothetical protein
VNVYAVPFVKPDTTHDNAPDDHEHVSPVFAVTVYPVIVAPPVDNGATHDTVT